MTQDEKLMIAVKYLTVMQPLGEFYIASIPSKVLVNITDFDVRRVLYEQRDIERYLGIQRPLSKNRVNAISEYVNTKDACFPTGVIIAIPLECIDIDEKNERLLIHNIDHPDRESKYSDYRNIARVLDGQHRLAALKNFRGEEFDVNVSIFVDIDIADQANIFSTVNLAQTKVNKSLAYDLFDLAKSRSPQKVCHNIVVTLDREKGSPFFKMIKRLGVATEGRSGETLTQATVINGMLPYISIEAMKDRDLYLRGKRPAKVSEDQLRKVPFQHLYVDEEDFKITDIIWNYFSAIQQRWPEAWESRERGLMLNRTNGYLAFIKFLRPLYLSLVAPGGLPSVGDYLKILKNVDLRDRDFNVDRYKPGSAGASALLQDLSKFTNIS